MRAKRLKVIAKQLVPITKTYGYLFQKLRIEMIHLALTVASFLFLAAVGFVAFILVLNILAGIFGWTLARVLRIEWAKNGAVKLLEWLITPSSE